MVRVTRPGGRVLLVAYGSPAEFEALQFFISALRPSCPRSRACPNLLRWNSRSPIRMCCATRATAGLVDVEVDTTHQERVEIRSGQECWNWMCGSNPIVGMILDDVSAPDQHRRRCSTG